MPTSPLPASTSASPQQSQQDEQEDEDLAQLGRWLERHPHLLEKWLKEQASQNYHSLIALPETWLDQIRSKFSAFGLKIGGGVAMAVRNDFKSSSIGLCVCPSFKNINPKIDVIVVIITTKYWNIYVISLYIPTQISVSDYETFVGAIQSLVLLRGSSIFIVGYFNVTSYGV
nr:unnamed protein product [Callosobruchus analis]